MKTILIGPKLLTKNELNFLQLKFKVIELK